MNKSVNPAVAFLVILFFGGLIGLNFFFNQRMLEVERPTFFANTPDDRLAIQFGRQLFLIDGDSGDEVVVDLDELGFADNIGNFDFFANGDLLLRLGNAKREISETWDVVMRTANHNYEQADGNFIARCNLNSKECQEFSAYLPGFDRAFRVYIERDTDTVYVADTSRHRLLKIDSSGRLLATAQGFKFPNQITLVDDQLWVADTNNHRVVAVSPKTETFGEVLSEISISPDAQHVWPSAFERIGRDWWVLAMGNNMSYGRVVRYTDTGVELDQLDMPPGADPLSLALWGDEILVTDYGRLAFYRYDRSGVRQVDFSTPSLARLITEKRAEIQRWRYAGYACWVVFALALLVGFFVAIRQQRQSATAQEILDASSGRTFESVPAAGVWIEARRVVRWLPYVFVVLLILPAVLFIPLFVEEKPFPLELLVTVSAMLLPLLLMARPLLKLSKVRFRVFDTHIELIDHEEQRYRSRFEDIFWYSQGSFVLGKQVIPVGKQSQQGIFPKKDIDRWVAPRLLPENKVGVWAMMKYFWNSPDGMMRYSTFMLLMLGLLCLYLEREGVLTFLEIF